MFAIASPSHYCGNYLHGVVKGPSQSGKEKFLLKNQNDLINLTKVNFGEHKIRLMKTRSSGHRKRKEMSKTSK